MGLTVSDSIWNRAALERGGAAPRQGDRALSSLLLFHGLVMNGGVHHALDGMAPPEISAAAEGYAFLGLHGVASFIRGAADNAVLSTRTGATEAAADKHYAEMIPDDSYLVARFEELYRQRPEQFAPIEGS